MRILDQILISLLGARLEQQVQMEQIIITIQHNPMQQIQMPPIITITTSKLINSYSIYYILTKYYFRYPQMQTGAYPFP